MMRMSKEKFIYLNRAIFSISSSEYAASARDILRMTNVCGVCWPRSLVENVARWKFVENICIS